MRKPAVFLDGISAFMAEIQMIRPDFTGEQRARFDELAAVVPKCKAHNTVGRSILQGHARQDLVTACYVSGTLILCVILVLSAIYEK